MRAALFSLALLMPELAQAQLHGALSEGRHELAAIQIDEDGVRCTGTLISFDMVMTHRDCVLGEDDDPSGQVSVLPGLNMADTRGPGAVKPLPREFGVRLHELQADDGVAFLQLGLIEGRIPPRSMIAISDAITLPDPGDPVGILHYGGAQNAAQGYAECGVLSLYGGIAELDCTLPATARGAPVLVDGEPVGVVSDPSAPDGAAVAFLPADGLPDAEEMRVTELPGGTFAGVDVLNLCDVDVHQGLFWLGLDGESWRDLARRVPARSRVLLPVATIGDAIFSYARADDGARTWSGTDLTVRIKGIDLPMARVDVPRPTGDVTLVYECEEED